jgi:hypothetical protein
MLSAVRLPVPAKRPITEWMPQESLPLIPPRVFHWCVAGSGANISPDWLAASRRSSRTQPGCTRPNRRAVSISSTRRMYFEQSITAATLHVCPAMLVPPPRAMIGASNCRQTATVSTKSASSSGRTTPIGVWR